MTKKQAGFTLIELMVAIAIVAVLVAIAYPGYQDFVRRTRRTDATKDIMRYAAAQERYLTNCNGYAPAMNGSQSACTGLGNASATPLSENGYYQISMVATATTFTFTATPQAEQAKDTGCANLTLTNTGVKGVSGTSPAAKCWGG